MTKMSIKCTTDVSQFSEVHKLTKWNCRWNMRGSPPLEALRCHAAFLTLVLIFPWLHMGLQTVHLGAESELYGGRTRIQLVGRSQSESSGRNCHFMQTLAQLSENPPCFTLQRAFQSRQRELWKLKRFRGHNRQKLVSFHSAPVV